MDSSQEGGIELVPSQNETPVSSRGERAVTEVGLLPLEGLSADVAAAKEIRCRILMAADDYLSLLRTNQVLTGESKDTDITVSTPVTRPQVMAAQVALNRLRHKTQAQWWIERQDLTVQTLFDEVGEEGITPARPPEEE